MTQPGPAPKVSVCVPTFNRAAYLRESLPTLLRQDTGDYEVLVVDNDSTDDTAEVVRSFNDPRIRYVRNDRNLGSRGNWNRCIELAAGEYVAICHDDDLYAPAFVGACRTFLEDNPSVGFVHCGFDLIDAAGSQTSHYLAYPTTRVLPSAVVFRSFLSEIHNVGFSSVMARRSAYLEVGPFVADFLCADFDMWLRLAFRYDVGYISRCLVSYRAHAESTTHALSPFRWYEENLEIVERAIAMAAPAIPELNGERDRILAGVQACWARRCLREAVSRASQGNVEQCREYVQAASSLSNTATLRVQAAVVRVVLGPVATAPLRMARAVWRWFRRSPLRALLGFGRPGLERHADR